MRRSWKRSSKAAPASGSGSSGSFGGTNHKRKHKSSPKRESRRFVASSSQQSREIREILSKKRSEFIEQTTKELTALVEKHGRLSEKLDTMGDRRMHILPRRILQSEMDALWNRVRCIRGGQALSEFDSKLASFRRVHRNIEKRAPRGGGAAVVEVAAKKPKRAKKKSLGNRRKSAAHNRDIRVSSSNKVSTPTFDVLMDEIEGEFADELGAEEDGAPPPVLYVCNRNFCPDCETVLMQKLPTESALACPECGVSTSYIDSTAASTGHSDDRSFNQFAYSRSNHFLQWMRSCQGKESVTVPEDILQGVCRELAKKRVQVDDITSRKIRECLKTMRQRKYYEHVVLITSLLTGKTPPRFTPQVERTLQRLFQKIQKPFEIAVTAICPERKNFLSYSYILTKLCGLLRDSIDARWLTAWPSLKGKDKIYRSDRLWAHMCKQLRWKYYPSI